MLAADSSYFVALADSRDKWHQDALSLKPKMPREILISDLVVAESITIIGERGGGKAARTLYEYFVDQCEIEFVDRQLLDEAMTMHLQFNGTLSVADCVSVTLMSKRGIQELVSFDSAFDKVRGLKRIH